MELLLLHILILSTLHFPKSHAYPTENGMECPTDCICYSDYLHNLESWKWVKPDVHLDTDDPEHESFNPYLEHNEVMENPKLHRKRQRESVLSTVNCMIRTNDSDLLDRSFRSISSNTQVLSLIQAPGSGVVHLKKNLFRNFHSLIGLEIKGYNDKDDKVEMTGDCLADLQSLTYLNLETVQLLHASVENNVHDMASRFLRINYTFNDVTTNEITSHVLIIPSDEAEDKEKDIIPYSEYKKEVQAEKTAPLQPTFRVAFTELPKLQHLKMTGCNLHDLSWDMFYKLDSLKYLILDENDLLFLPDFVFFATSNLTALSLSGNRILNLQTVGLAGLLYLQKLDVTYNNITHLSELSLPPFPHLEVADFRHNPITSIFPNTFEIMNSTKSLYLGSNTTPLDLSPNSFFGLSSLTKLDITNVKIRLLEKSMLKGMPTLKTLIMTGSIPRISYDAFGEVTTLEKLILRNCGIKKISMDALFGLYSLTELDLSHNSLTFLPPGIFEDQRSLREVLLQHNQLTTLPPNLIENLPVKIFRLENNPWHCSCDMRNWNPQQVNRVKRYHIPAPNNTLCQKVYDKGSMCFETYEPKFEVTYSYEKRVSPVCETPMKFNQRSVFQVLRRELKYCIKQNNAKESKAPEKLEPIRNSEPYPENYSLDTLKALEKQLLAKPIKVKKNRTISAAHSATDQEQQLDLDFDNNRDNFVGDNLLSINPNVIAEDSKPVKLQQKLDINEIPPPITEIEPEKNLIVQPGTDQSPITENVTATHTQKSNKVHIQTRNKTKGKKKNKNKKEANTRTAQPYSNPETFPSISKKAMKLAKMLAKQSMQI